MQSQAGGIALAVLLLPISGLAQRVSIEKDGDAFKVVGWKAPATPPADGWASLFSVQAGSGDVPAMLGTYAIEDGSLLFRPRFAPAPGVPVRATFRNPAGLPIHTSFEAAGRPARATSKVQRVYPSADELPLNQLKFYIHFSAPMQRGEAWQRIHLLNEKGARIELPFLELDQELWDRENTRLTVLFDPGRIKRGVLPLEEVGSAIEEGKQYTLVVDKDWRDAKGAPLLHELRKTFLVGRAERNPIDPHAWKITPPVAGGSTPLIVDLGRPMDSALLIRLLDVPGVSGRASVEANETRWRFVPDRPWKAGSYRLTAGAALEDLAGNRIGRAFDVDIFDPITRRVEHKTISIAFRVFE